MRFPRIVFCISAIFRFMSQYTVKPKSHAFNALAYIAHWKQLNFTSYLVPISLEACQLRVLSGEW